MDKKPLPGQELVVKALAKNEQIIDGEIIADDALQITRWLLKLLGIWPLSPDASNLEKTLKYLIILLCLFFLSFIIVPGILLIKVDKERFVALKLSGALSFCTMATLEYLTLISKRKDIAVCINHLIADWKKVTSSDDCEVMTKYAKMGRWGAIACTTFMISGGIFYSVILPVVTPIVLDENNATIKLIAYPSHWGAFNPQGHVAYRIIYCTQCGCAIVMHSIASASCNVAVVFSLHACSQLKIITRPLRDLVDGTSTYQELDEILPGMIQNHTRALRFIDNLEKVLSNICLVEMVGRSVSLCLLIYVCKYYLMPAWQETGAIGVITYALLMISESFNIFLYCYIGDLVNDECRKVGESTYMVNWYKLSAKSSRQITLMLITAQNPVSITAGKVIDLSLATFVSVLKTSVVYLNLLREVTD